jgi:hypothetical protein
MQYINNCKTSTCAYCIAHDDESNWEHADMDDDYEEWENSTNVFKYRKFFPEQLIREFHGDSADSIIAECQSFVKEFYDNIAANRVLESTIAKFNNLYDVGCYIKRYIKQQLQNYANKNDFDINMLVRDCSKDTNIYYYKVIGMTEGWYLSLYFASRYDVLVELHDHFNETASCLILHYFSSLSIPVSEEMLIHLAKYTGAENVLQTCVDICARNLNASLVKQKPALNTALPLQMITIECDNIHVVNIESLPTQPEIETAIIRPEQIITNPSNLPKELIIMECEAIKLTNTFDIPAKPVRLFNHPGWNTETVTTWDITRIVTCDVFELVMRSLHLLFPDTETRKIIMSEHFKDNSLLLSMNHFRSDLYKHLIAEVLRLSA